MRSLILAPVSDFNVRPSLLPSLAIAEFAAIRNKFAPATYDAHRLLRGGHLKGEGRL